MNIVIFSVVLLTYTITLVHLRTVEQREIEENEVLTNFGNEICRCEDYCSYVDDENFTVGVRCSHINGSTVYFECQPNSCSIKFCQPNQLYSYETSKCEYCKAGYRVDKKSISCICNEGTTLNIRGSKCVPCPEGAILDESNSCFCPPGKIHDDVRHVCRKCPDNAKLYRDTTCRCRNKTFFLSEVEWICKECPGVLIKDDYNYDRYFCHCQGENEIFNRWSSTCVQCPPDSVKQVIRQKQECTCEGENLYHGHYYDHVRNTCVHN